MGKEYQTSDHRLLAELLFAIVSTEITYNKRMQLIFLAMSKAMDLGYKVGIRYDDDAGTEWPVCCIDLPEVGEVSWHVEGYDKEYTGYDNEEKEERVKQFYNLTNE